MKDLTWTGGRTTPQNLVGAETYMYYSQGWNFTINYPVVPNAIYKINADYSATSISIPYRITGRAHGKMTPSTKQATSSPNSVLKLLCIPTEFS